MIKPVLLCALGLLHLLQPCIVDFSYLRMSSESAEMPQSSVVTKTIRVEQASQEHDLTQPFPGSCT